MQTVTINLDTEAMSAALATFLATHSFDIGAAACNDAIAKLIEAGSHQPVTIQVRVGVQSEPVQG